MTISVSDNTPRVSYSVSAGATQTSFTVSFEFFADADLNVYVDGTKKTLTTHYSVTGGDGSTGSISMSVTGASGGSTVVITRGIALERTTDFPVSGAFAVGTLNTELDRFVAIQADLNDTITRSIRLADDDTAVTMELPDKADRLGKVLSFHSTTGAVQVQTYASPDATAGIDGVTAGTVAASKFLQVDANRDLSTIRNLTSDGTITASSFVIGSAAINENDLEALDDVTAGTVAASKAAIVDTNKDITGFRNITLTGELDAATLDISGAIDVAGNSVLASVDVTGVATAATFEPDGDTSAGDNAAIGYTSTEGLILTGQGSSHDVTLKNDADTVVAYIPTGTAKFDVVGSFQVTASGGAKAYLTTSETTVVADDSLGALEWYAVAEVSGTDSLAKSGAIECTAEGTFTDTANPTQMLFKLGVSEAATTKMTLSSGGNLTVTGDLTITGDDLFMNTNTSGYMLVADGTNYNPVAISGDVTMAASGAVTIANDAVEQAMIADDAVGADQLAASAVVTASIVDDAVTQAKIADDAVGADQLAADAVVTASIADDAVSLAKMAGLARGNIIYGDSSGNPAALAAGTDGYYLKSDGTDISWASVSAGATAADDIGTGDAAVTIATSSGNITFDAQGNDTDIIFKGTDGSADTTFLTLDGSEAGAASFNGVVTANAGVVVDNITIDGTEIDLSSGDLTIDVAGDLILDTGGRDTKFNYAGTQELNIHTGTGSTVISTTQSDRNLDFGGNDGGSDITVLSFDMSESGYATFKAGAVFNEDSLDSDFRVESNGDANCLIVDAGLDAVLMGTSTEYSGTPAKLTVADAADFGTTSSTGSAAVNFVRAASTGVIGGIFGKWSGYGNGGYIKFNADNVGGGAQTASIVMGTTVNNSVSDKFNIAGNGDLTAADTTIGSISDQRLKENIADFTYDISKFKQLKPRSYKWKNPIYHGNRVDDDGNALTSYGTIAQEVAAVDADYVRDYEIKDEVNDDKDLLDSDNIVKTTTLTGKQNAMYISVIQQLISKVETLETKVAALEGG